MRFSSSDTQILARRNFRCGTISPDPSDAGVGKAELSRDFFSTIRFDLLAFDWPQRFGAGHPSKSCIQFPQSPCETSSSAVCFELDPLRRHFAEMDLAFACGDSRPAEVVSGAKFPQLGKISRRVFGQGCFPIWRRRHRPKHSEQECAGREVKAKSVLHG